MKLKNAYAKIQVLVIAHRAIPKHNGLICVLDNNLNVAVHHLLGGIDPQSFRKRLEADLDGRRPELRMHFPTLIELALGELNAFNMLNLSSTSRRQN